jgi:hypothetical protein
VSAFHRTGLALPTKSDQPRQWRMDMGPQETPSPVALRSSSCSCVLIMPGAMLSTLHATGFVCHLAAVQLLPPPPLLPVALRLSSCSRERGASCLRPQSFTMASQDRLRETKWGAADARVGIAACSSSSSSRQANIHHLKKVQVTQQSLLLLPLLQVRLSHACE